MSTLTTSGEKVNRLVDLVRSQIETDPFEYDGHQWMDWPKPSVADHLSITARTLTRIAVPQHGVVAKSPLIDGRKRYLLRIGTDTKTPRDLRNILSALWRKHIGRSTTRDEFGCICGMVEQWGDHSPEIFADALRYWPTFMACFKIEFTDEYLNDQGYPTRHYSHVCLPVLRRFAHMAPEVYQGLKQGWLDKDAKAA